MILSQFNSPQYHFNVTESVIYIENFQGEQLFNRNLPEKLFATLCSGHKPVAVRVRDIRIILAISPFWFFRPRTLLHMHAHCPLFEN